VAAELDLAHGGREVELAGEADVLGDVREQVVDRRDADAGEHLPHVLVGVLDVGHRLGS
jgi:hypothetical protein